MTVTNIIIRNRNIYPAPIQRIVLTRVSQRVRLLVSWLLPKPNPHCLLLCCRVVRLVLRIGDSYSVLVELVALPFTTNIYFCEAQNQKCVVEHNVTKLNTFKRSLGQRMPTAIKTIIIDQLFTQAV